MVPEEESMNKPRARDKRKCIMCKSKPAMLGRYYCNKCLQKRAQVSREDNLGAGRSGLTLQSDYRYHLDNL